MHDQSEIFEIVINSSSHSYLVKIGPGQLQNLQGGDRKFVICDARFSELLREMGINEVVDVVAIEENKNLRTVEELLIQLQKLGMKRGDKIVAIGGGIIQDLATISASLFMRGVDWIYYPTTLLGMSDSCIGGKSSINAGVIKNLVGNIYPPQEIVIDTDFIQTLGAVDVNAGLTEAVKICFCKGPNEFNEYLKLATGSESIHYTIIM
jgi:3-dehydroquinate synthase